MNPKCNYHRQCTSEFNSVYFGVLHNYGDRNGRMGVAGQSMESPAKSSYCDI